MIQVHEDYLQFRGIYIITLVVVDVYYVDVYYVDVYYVAVYYVAVYYVDIYYVDIYYVDVYYVDIYYVDVYYVDVYYVDVYYVDVYYVDVYYVDVYYGLDLINQFNTIIFLCLSQARTWISNNICILCSLLCSVSSVKMRGDLFIFLILVEFTFFSLLSFSAFF